MVEAKRIVLRLGDIIELRKVESIVRPFQIPESERQIVIEVEDAYVVLRSMDVPDKMSTMLSNIDINIKTGHIIGTINRFLISRDLNE